MFRRSNSLFKAQTAGSSSPLLAQAYRVVVTPRGAVVASASGGSTITVDAGHSFQAGDKFLRVDGNGNYTFSAAIDSVTATTLVFSPETYTVAAGDALINLGEDNGTTAPQYDGIRMAIYAQPDKGGAYTNNTVTASATGEYGYYYQGDGLAWELILDDSSNPQGVVQGFGGNSGRLNAADFGLVLDGAAATATANARAMQAVVDAANGTGTDRVFIPDGVAVLDATINLYTQQIIEGAGQQATFLRMSTGNAMFTNRAPATNILYGQISDMTLSAMADSETDTTNAIGTSALLLDNFKGWTFSRLFLSGWLTAGVEFNSSVASQFSGYNKFYDITTSLCQVGVKFSNDTGNGANSNSFYNLRTFWADVSNNAGLTNPYGVQITKGNHNLFAGGVSEAFATTSGATAVVIDGASGGFSTYNTFLNHRFENNDASININNNSLVNSFVSCGNFGTTIGTVTVTDTDNNNRNEFIGFQDASDTVFTKFSSSADAVPAVEILGTANGTADNPVALIHSANTGNNANDFPCLELRSGRPDNRSFWRATAWDGSTYEEYVSWGVLDGLVRTGRRDPASTSTPLDGGKWTQNHWVESVVISSSVSTAATTATIPAGSVIRGFTVRITEAVVGATAVDMQVTGGLANGLLVAVNPVADGLDTVYTPASNAAIIHQGLIVPATATLTLDFAPNATDGTFKITIWYDTWTDA